MISSTMEDSVLILKYEVGTKNFGSLKLSAAEEDITATAEALNSLQTDVFESVIVRNIYMLAEEL